MQEFPSGKGLHQHTPPKGVWTKGEKKGEKKKKGPFWSESKRAFVCMVMHYLFSFLPLNDLWLEKMSNMMYGACGRSPGSAPVRFHFFCFPSIKRWGLSIHMNAKYGPQYPWKEGAGRGIFSVSPRVDLVKKRVQNTSESSDRNESSREGTLYTNMQKKNKKKEWSECSWQKYKNSCFGAQCKKMEQMDGWGVGEVVRSVNGLWNDTSSLLNMHCHQAGWGERGWWGGGNIMTSIVCTDACRPALLQVVTGTHPLTGCEPGRLLRVLPAPPLMRRLWTVVSDERPWADERFCTFFTTRCGQAAVVATPDKGASNKSSSSF